MKLLLDTHLLLWAATRSKRLSRVAARLIEDKEHALFFSAATVLELAIKSGLGRADFRVDANRFRRELLENEYAELAVSGQHAAAVSTLPAIHKDPFDRVLVAQALVEGMVLLTADQRMARYGAAVRCV